MKQTLSYGKISWAYDGFDPDVPCRPFPLMKFTPVKIKGHFKTPTFSDKLSLQIIKLRARHEMSFQEAYTEWVLRRQFYDKDLSEGRSFIKWLKDHDCSIKWKNGDYKLHDYFCLPNSPRHDPYDEMAENLSFAIKPVEVNQRKVKLYLQDEAVLNLISLPFGEDHDFISLVKEYVTLRFQWEKWRAPAPPFLDWVKAQAKRPVFSKGQLGFCQ